MSPQSIVLDLDCSPLNPQHLSNQWSKPRHRPTKLAAEDLDKLVELRVRRVVVDKDPDLPVPLGHHLRRISDEHGLAPSEIGSVDCTLTNIEDKSHAAQAHQESSSPRSPAT